MDGGIGVGQPLEVGTEHVVTLMGTEVLDKARMGVREDHAQAVQEPLHLFLAAEEHAAKDTGGYPFGPGLGIGESEGGAPRSAKQQPPLDA